MALNSSTKSELQAGREAMWFFLHSQSCYFCQCFLLDAPGRCGVLMTGLTFGHRRHKAFPQDVTLHHIDENRENNDPKNLAWCHESCHRSYHARKRAAVRKEVVKQYNNLQGDKENVNNTVGSPLTTRDSNSTTDDTSSSAGSKTVPNL